MQCSSSSIETTWTYFSASMGRHVLNTDLLISAIPAFLYTRAVNINERELIAQSIKIGSS